MRRAIFVGLGLVAGAGLLGVAGVVVIVNVTNPRDESAYITYLETYGSTAGTPPVTLPSRGLLIAEGDRACDWLAGDTWALWRTTAEYRFPAVLERYDREVSGAPTAWVGAPSQDTVASAAWGYLCPATEQLHKPHYVFNSPAE